MGEIRILFTRVENPVDETGPVVGDEQASLGAGLDIHGAAPL